MIWLITWKKAKASNSMRQSILDKQRRIQGVVQENAGPPPPPPSSFFFCDHLFFSNHFKELQTVLFEVELIISNAPLTYVYPNTIDETCLKPTHLLFGRQLLYSSNTTSTVVRNLTVLSRTADKINRISNHFLDRWRHEFTWNTMNIKIKNRLPKN